MDLLCSQAGEQGHRGLEGDDRFLGSSGLGNHLTIGDPNDPASSAVPPGELVLNLATEVVRLLGYEGALHSLEYQPHAGPGTEDALELIVRSPADERREGRFSGGLE